MPDYVYLSQEGYDKLSKELDDLKHNKRPEITKKIAEARAFGDLKENAEYHAAKEAQTVLEAKITQLEQTLRRAKILKREDMAEDRITILSRVKLKDLYRNVEVEYTLVSPQESDSRENKISTASPVGKALLGKKIGDIIEIKVPAGTLKYQVMDLKLSI